MCKYALSFSHLAFLQCILYANQGLGSVEITYCFALSTHHPNSTQLLKGLFIFCSMLGYKAKGTNSE